ncbi:tRNA-splicing endonuclease subunit Sen34 [Podochytrium sp. JEL0797]|nr:tRNA-splicing endonuclease subunit Sen34 [Podochytrium sp. JEL0797]
MRVHFLPNANDFTFLLFNAKDSLTLRSQHRICGNYTGTYHTTPMQNRHFALPMELLACQVSWLLHEGIITLHPMTHDNYASLLLNSVPADMSSEHEFLEHLIVQELAASESRRQAHAAARALLKERLYGFSPKAKVGKKKQKGRLETVVVEDGGSSETREQHASAKHASKYSRLPGARNTAVEESVESVVGTRNEAREFVAAVDLEGGSEPTRLVMAYLNAPFELGQNLRFAKQRVFESLWTRGFHVTSGLKFGGDFLVYPGDPLLFHATHVAVVILQDAKISPFDMISYARMGRNAKKKILLCQWDEVGQSVRDIVIDWTGWK